MSNAERVAIACEVIAECDRQDDKWGEQNHPDGTGDEIYRDAAEDARHDCEQAAAEGRVTWRHIFIEEAFEAIAESDPVELRGELLQVAAVAIAWADAIDRAGAAKPPEGRHAASDVWDIEIRSGEELARMQDLSWPGRAGEGDRA